MRIFGHGVHFRRYSAAFLLAAFVVAAPVKAAFTHDFNGEYDSVAPVANPNGVWQYRYANENAANSASTLMADHNFGATIWDFGGDQYTIVDTTVAHPGTSTDSLITFVYPDAVAGNVQVASSVSYTQTNSQAKGVDVSYWLNNTQLGGTFNLRYQADYVTNPQIATFNNTVSMNPGDNFYVRFSNPGGGLFGNGSVPSITFTSVPEPGSLSLFGLGAAGLLSARRRRNV